MPELGAAGSSGAGEGEEAPAAIGLDRVAQVHRLGVGQTDDRRGMEPRADRQPLGQMLMRRLAGEDRRTVTGRRSRGIAPVPDEIVLGSAGSNRLAFRGFCGCAEHAGPLAIEVDQFLGDGLTFRRVGMQEARRAPLPQDRRQLPAEVEAVLHGDVHALARLRAVGVAGVAGDEHAGQPLLDLLFRHVVELVGKALADLVDRPPGNLLHVERIGLEDPLRRRDQIVGGDVAIRDPSRPRRACRVRYTGGTDSRPPAG